MTDKITDPEQSTKFTDLKGRTWDTTLTLGAAQRVDNSDFSDITPHKFSILQPSKDFFLALLSDTRLLWAVIWAIVYTQAEEHPDFADLMKDPNDQEAQDRAQRKFVDAIGPQTLRDGKGAFWQSLENFTPENATVLSSLRQNWDGAYKRLETEIQGLEPDIQTALDRSIQMEMTDIRTKLSEVGRPPKSSAN